MEKRPRRTDAVIGICSLLILLILTEVSEELLPGHFWRFILRDRSVWWTGLYRHIDPDKEQTAANFTPRALCRYRDNRRQTEWPSIPAVFMVVSIIPVSHAFTSNETKSPLLSQSNIIHYPWLTGFLRLQRGCGPEAPESAVPGCLSPRLCCILG